MELSGEFKIQATALGFHTIDRFRTGKIEPVAEIKFGIECGGSFNVKLGNIYSLEAELKGEAYAAWKITLEESIIHCHYEGLYAVIETKVKSTSNNNNDTRNTGENSKEPEKFLLHDGFSYEFKFD